jgi:hypothetical protein
VDNSLQLERHLTFCVPETILIHLHRSFFARALSESPEDPLKSRYADSVVAIHASVCKLALSVSTELSLILTLVLVRHLEAVKSLFSLLPDLTMRFWLFWSHSFSGAVSWFTEYPMFLVYLFHIALPAGIDYSRSACDSLSWVITRSICTERIGRRL